METFYKMRNFEKFIHSFSNEITYFERKWTDTEARLEIYESMKNIRKINKNRSFQMSLFKSRVCLVPIIIDRGRKL